MIFFQKIFALSVLAVGFFLANAHIVHAKPNGQLFFCEGDDRSWTLHESSQPRMFHQEITMSGPGIFTVTMRANGFGYKGYSYTRPSAWNKWQFVQQTNSGKRTWAQTWQIYKEEHRLGLVQLIKDSNTCKNCTITMTMSTSNCPLISHEESITSFGARAEPTSKAQCGYDHCYTGDTGSMRCLPHIGWDGTQCPF